MKVNYLTLKKAIIAQLNVQGYINNPEAIADCIDNEGYFHTGDIVVVDKNEHFFVVDRLKELIKYKGFQVKTKLKL